LNVYFKKYLKKIGSFAPCCLVYSVLLVVNILKKFKQLNLFVGKGHMKCGGGLWGKKAKQN
jgi:hypothetical protein